MMQLRVSMPTLQGCSLMRRGSAVIEMSTETGAGGNVGSQRLQ